MPGLGDTGEEPIEEVVSSLSSDLRDGWRRLQEAQRPDQVRAAADLCEAVIQLVGRLPLALFVASGERHRTAVGGQTVIRRCLWEDRDRKTGVLRENVLREGGILPTGWWLGIGRTTAEVLPAFLQGTVIESLYLFHRDYAADLDALLEYRNGAAHGIKHPPSVLDDWDIKQRLARCLRGLSFLGQCQFEVHEAEAVVVRKRGDESLKLSPIWVEIVDGDVRFSGSASFQRGFWEQSFGAQVERYKEERRGRFDFSERLKSLQRHEFEAPPGLEGASLEDGLLLVTGCRLTGKSMTVANVEKLPLASGRHILRFFCEPDGPTCSGLSFLLWLRRGLDEALVGRSQLKATMDFEQALKDIGAGLATAAEHDKRFLVAIDDVDQALRYPYFGEPTLRETIGKVRGLDGTGDILAFLLTAIPGSWRDLRLTRGEILLRPQDNPWFDELCKVGSGWYEVVWKDIGGHLHALRRDILGVLRAAGRSLTSRQIAAALEAPSFRVRHELRELRSVLEVQELDEDKFCLYSNILDPVLTLDSSEAAEWDARIKHLDAELEATKAAEAAGRA